MDIKTIKEFFRPTKVKVLLFIVFVVILLIEIGLSLLLHYLSPGWGQVIMFPFIYPTYFLFTSGISTIIALIAVLCMVFGSSYLLSCLIAFLYRYLGNFKYKFLKPVFVIVIILILFLPLSIETQPQPQEKQIFLSSCEHYCTYGDKIVRYCSRRYNEDDWNSNGVKNEIVRIDSASESLYACEDRIYCFLAVPCKKLGSNSTEIIQNCAELLCNNYLEKYDGNVEYASEAVLENIKISSNSTECNFLEIPDKDDWHKRFFPENVCKKYIIKTIN